MITIPIRVCGDYWFNPEEVRSQLDAIAGQDQITLDLQFEGPCLEVLGISSMINNYCNKYQINHSDIQIQRWDNTVEPTEYTVVDPPKISHFFDVSRRYDWDDTLPKDTHEHLFGFFIGRRTLPRAVIMHRLFHKWGSKNLLSCLDTKEITPWLIKNAGINIDNIDQWVPADKQQQFNDWWKTVSIPSIDQHHFDDQYSQDHNTNRDLLEHYYKFDIEIVAESYTRGSSFFPTEKTVRPLTCLLYTSDAADDLALAVDRLTERVDHASEHRVADRHREDAAGGLDGLSLFDLEAVTEHHRSDGLFVEVQCEADGAVFELQEFVHGAVGQARNACNTVAHLGDAAHGAGFQRGREALQVLLQRRCDVAGAQCQFSHVLRCSDLACYRRDFSWSMRVRTLPSMTVSPTVATMPPRTDGSTTTFRFTCLPVAFTRAAARRTC